jgi:hypothetical protein
MITSLRHIVGWILISFDSRKGLILENLALRQQLLALHSKRPRRRLSTMQKMFWVVLRSLWSRWQKPLILVTPRTVVEWHRDGFRLYWKWLCWRIWPYFSHLLHDPQGTGIPGDIEAQNLPAVITDHKEAVQHPKGESRDCEEIHCRANRPRIRAICI